MFRTGALMMVIGAGTFLFAGVAACVVYIVGTMLFTTMQLRASYDGHNFTLIRLRRQQMFGAAILVLSAVSMIYQWMGHYMVRYNEWVVCLLVGAIFELYTAFRIPQELEKEKR